VQAGEKLLLAEGSKMVMAMGQSAYDQGVYGLVSSLGSLVVRTLFQPVEEAAFTAFSKQGEHAAHCRVNVLTLMSPHLEPAVNTTNPLGLAVVYGPTSVADTTRRRLRRRRLTV